MLVSEAMHNLGVPTTRALSLVLTGQSIQRPWYSDEEIKTGSSPSKYAPNRLVNEPGAIVCRVAKSFLRFSHLEIFSKRSELPQLMDMADFVCLREFPHLLAEYKVPLPLL